MSKHRILAVATNADPELNGKRTGLWLSELTHFLHVIDQAGLPFDVVSPAGGRIPLDENSVTGSALKDAANTHFLASPSFKSALESSTPVSEVRASDYAAIFLSGGHGTMWDFRQSADLQRAITEVYTAGGIVSGVCHGVAGFVDSVDETGALLVEGRAVTGFSNVEDAIGRTKKLMPFLLEDALKANGARYRKNLLPFTSRVEVDGRLITGQNPQSARAVGSAVLSALLR